MSEATPRKRRVFSKNTATWQLFEKFFLKTEPEAYPILLGPYTKGQALNLAIGMNTCHVQHKEETGMPEEFMMYSAKPQEKPDGWWIEISTNYTRTGKQKPSRKTASTGWLEKLLEKGGSEPVSARAPVSPAVDPQEDLLASLYGTKEENKP